jgi:predicted small lipoprotein YifL
VKQSTIAVLLVLLAVAGCDPVPPDYAPRAEKVPDPGTASFHMHGAFETGVSSWSR